MADNRITVGKVQITCLSDHTLVHPLPLARLFPSVQTDSWEDYRRRYPQAFDGPSEWRVNVGCYLLRSRGRTILVDAGIGAAGGAIATSFDAPLAGRLLETLQSDGIHPEDVDVVVMTHLHWDHVGWLLLPVDGQPRLTFPRARYLIQRADWETFHRPDVQAAMPVPYVGLAVTPLQRLGGLDLIDGDYQITEEVTAIHTPGHTPGHTSLLIASEGRSAVITGDSMVNPAQVADPDCLFFFDMDRDLARKTRHRLLERIEAEEMIAIGGHFPDPGFGRIVRVDGRRSWQAL